jgi:CubicO group peptidase (beta-lactamase class C family)
MRIILFLFLTIVLSSCWVVRGYKVRKFNLADHARMPSVPVQKADQPYQFINAKTDPGFSQLAVRLDKELESSLTAAFVVIRNDSILYERYFNGFSEQSLFPSFSIAKSYISTLMAIAIEEGKIPSTQVPVTKYLPELLKTDKAWAKVTLQHLLDMRSGASFRENGKGIDDAIKLGFRPNLPKHAFKTKMEREPGETFIYQSVNTELLGLVLERATGMKVSAYLQEKIWKPLGAEYNATWNVDNKRRKNELAFAGLNATARDFAKLGQLYLNEGKWNGKQIVNADWIRKVSRVDSMEKMHGYHNQWWSRYRYKYFKDSTEAALFEASTPFATEVRNAKGGYSVAYRTSAFHAAGMLNQYVYVNPEKNVVIVRLGRYWSHPKFYPDQFLYELGAEL